MTNAIDKEGRKTTTRKPKRKYIFNLVFANVR